MKVLMISLDKTLLGADYSGDVLERHKKYAQYIDELDIIVLSKKGFNEQRINDKLFIYPTNSLSKLFYVQNACKIAKKLFSKNKFDLVVTQEPFLTALAGWKIKKKFKVPLLVHFHGDFWQNKYWLKEKWYNRCLLVLSKFLAPKADGIRVVSSGIKEKLLKAKIPESKIRIIPTPVDLAKFSEGDEKRIAKIRKEHGEKKTIINVGRLDSSKDYPALFKTIALVYEKYRNLAFCQVGAGFYLSEKIRVDENLILTSFGKLEQKELINYYHAVDVYVSSSCHESFGKVLVEAMACGLPVVATATTGSKEIVVNEKNGFLVPVGDEKALAKKVLYLLNEPEIAKQMGEAGRKMVRERFNQQKTIQKIINFWRKLI